VFDGKLTISQLTLFPAGGIKWCRVWRWTVTRR